MNIKIWAMDDSEEFYQFDTAVGAATWLIYLMKQKPEAHYMLETNSPQLKTGETVGEPT